VLRSQAPSRRAFRSGRTAMSTFDRQYFERDSSYAAKGGYGTIIDDVKRFYAQYFRLAAEVAPEVARGAGKKALEVGCAFGVGIEQLRGWEYDAYGTDVSEYAIDQARRLYGDEQHFAVADAQVANPFGIGFDLVVAIHVVEHLRDIAAAVHALADALAAGGHLLLATPNPRSLSPYRRFQRDPTHVNEHAPSVWAAMLEKNSLRILSCKTFHLIPFVHRWTGLKYVATPEWLGYDAIIVARRD